MAEEKTRRIKILSDDTLVGPRVIDVETGEDWTQYIETVDVHIDGIKPPRATIRTILPLADILAHAEFKPMQVLEAMLQQNATMRSLLELVLAEQEHRTTLTLDEICAYIRAFLAEHQEPGP
jgi:hypothetical protein